MKRQVLSVMAAGILSFMISGCAAKQVSLVEKNQVTVEKQGSQKVNILWMDVYQQDGQVWAYGVLEQQGAGTGAIQAHVDIRVMAPDGSVSYETSSKDTYVPRNRIGKGIDWTRFKVPLPEKLLEGSQVTMTVHSGDHKQPEAKS
jgi:hypothetical protein